MRQTRTWLFAFLPLLYLGIVLGFIGFQFSQKSDTFSQSLGDLTLAGKNGSVGQPAELTVRARGLDFHFDASRTLQVEGKDGSVLRLRPESWGWKDGAAIVRFSQGIELRFFKSGEGGRSLQVQPEGKSLGQVSALRLPFSLASGVRLDRSSGFNYVLLTQGKTVLLASVDGLKDRVELDNSFVLYSGASGFRPARLDPLTPGLDSRLAWLTLDASTGPDVVEGQLTQYWDRAYKTWSSASTFSTSLVNAWAREAVLRTDYPAVFSGIQGLLSKDRKAWSFGAVAYLGNVVELTGAKRRLVEAASSRSTPQWSEQPTLWSEARFYGPPGSADRVEGLLMDGRLPSDARELVGYLQNLFDLQKSKPSDALTNRIGVVQSALVGFVTRGDGNLFVQSGDGVLDLRATLILGRLWMDYSRTAGHDYYGLAGARLVSSVLDRQDDAARLPEFLIVQDGRVIRQEGQLAPEDLYASVKPQPAFETPIPEWGANGFLFTPATVELKSVSAKEARFQFRFPAGTAEHIILSGVPAFDHITMHGIRWRTDPQFQSYTDGWAYSAATKTLYVKIKHREDREELVVHFSQD